jgi:hypothetical protein
LYVVVDLSLQLFQVDCFVLSFAGASISGKGVVKVALATIPHPIGGDGSIAVIVAVVLVPIYSPLMHVRIAEGTISIIPRRAVLFFGILRN